LNLDCSFLSLFILALGVVATCTASPEALYKNRGAVTLKNTFEPVNVNIQVHEVLLSRAFVGVVSDVNFHEFVEASESVAERSVFDSLLVRYDIVVQRFQALNLIHDETPVARDLTHRVVEQCDMDDRRQVRQGLQVLPLLQSVIVQKQKLQRRHLPENLSRWEALDHIIA
jgi:hypothetical protein